MALQAEWAARLTASDKTDAEPVSTNVSVASRGASRGASLDSLLMFVEAGVSQGLAPATLLANGWEDLLQTMAEDALSSELPNGQAHAQHPQVGAELSPGLSSPPHLASGQSGVDANLPWQHAPPLLSNGQEAEEVSLQEDAFEEALWDVATTSDTFSEDAPAAAAAPNATAADVTTDDIAIAAQAPASAVATAVVAAVVSAPAAPVRKLKVIGIDDEEIARVVQMLFARHHLRKHILL